jgi:F-type H+-transporting ATPase subunit b|tara:strand:- start:167 stop:637 length:471 start_codon:yes stop_codon:yes gene_type:complete
LNINLTLIGQAISFAIFVLFCMKYVWPPLTSALEQRKKKISDGLSAAELGEQALEKAKVDVDLKLTDAKTEAKNIIAMAEKRQGDILDEAGTKASEETSRKMKLAEQEVEQLSMRLKESLKKDLSKLVVEGAEMILKKEIDKNVHDKAIQDLVTKI